MSIHANDFTLRLLLCRHLSVLCVSTEMTIITNLPVSWLIFEKITAQIKSLNFKLHVLKLLICEMMK